MLEELHLVNYVLFEQATLEFGSGLNAISGETGAGKSLIAGAISLALGYRATPDIIRSGADRAIITASFLIPQKLVRVFEKEFTLELDEDRRLIFSRTVRRDGRNRLTMNGNPASAANARAVGERLLDMAAQNEHTRLAEPSYQRELLDLYSRVGDEAFTFRSLFEKAASLKSRLDAGDAEREKVRRRLEEIRYLLKQVEEVGLDPDNDPCIEDRIAELSSAEAIINIAQGAGLILYEDEGSVQDRLGSLMREAEELSEVSPEIESAVSLLADISANVEEAVRLFREAGDKVDASAETLEETIERSEALKALARRFDCTVGELPVETDRLRTEVDNLSGWEGDNEQIRKEIDELLRQAADAGLKLRKKRTAGAKKLAKDVGVELEQLGMEQAGFESVIKPLWNEGEELTRILSRAGAAGLDDVEFMITPNPGEPASSLLETASGGECSRTMLAIKSALSGVHSSPVLLFDEIDSGIGGRLGEVIGQRLKSLSDNHQVIVITHLPQVAASADVHLKVSKNVSDKRTVASVQALGDEERVREVAMMIHGRSGTETTIKQAREMLGLK